MSENILNNEYGLPTNWFNCQLGDILNQHSAKTLVLPGESYTRLGVRWYADGPFVKDAVKGNEVKGRHLYRVQAGDLIYNRLFAWKGSFGVVRPEMDGHFVSNEFPIFKVDRTKAEPDFLWRWLSLPELWKYIEDKSSGSTRTSRLRFKEEDFLGMQICLPPLPEQQFIVKFLRVIRNAEEATAKSLAATRQLKQSLMRHLFTYGSVPFEQAEMVRLKETEIGPVPENWEIVRLGTIARIGNGSTPKRDNELYWVNGKIPWLNSGKVHESIIQHADQFVTEKAQEECHLPLVRKGSLVVAITGQGKTLGNTALVNINTCISQHLSYIEFHDCSVVPTFMLYYLQGRYDHLREIGQSGGSTKAALTCGFLKNYSVPLPSPEEQHQIAKILETCVRKLQAEEAKVQSVGILFKTMLESLMTGKVRFGT